MHDVLPEDSRGGGGVGVDHLSGGLLDGVGVGGAHDGGGVVVDAGGGLDGGQRGGNHQRLLGGGDGGGGLGIARRLLGGRGVAARLLLLRRGVAAGLMLLLLRGLVPPTAGLWPPGPSLASLLLLLRPPVPVWCLDLDPWHHALNALVHGGHHVAHLLDEPLHVPVPPPEEAVVLLVFQVEKVKAGTTAVATGALIPAVAIAAALICLQHAREYY